MKQVYIIARQTLKSAWRFRLMQVLVVVLAMLVLVVPLMVKHNGSAAAFTQVYLTYTLGSIGVFLGFATIWFACSSISREVEERQMQLLDTKPVSRWQVWLGKWLGLAMLNAVLITAAATGTYLMLWWKAGHLSANERQILERQILVSRAAIHEDTADIQAEVQRIYERRLKEGGVMTPEEQLALKLQVEADATAMEQLVPPNHQRPSRFDLSRLDAVALANPVVLRTKFHSPDGNRSRTYRTVVVVTEKTGDLLWRQGYELEAGKFHEIPLPAQVVAAVDEITVNLENRSDATLMYPPDEDAMILYHHGKFGANFIRAVGVILCWLCVLAALGLASGSYLSFPVASFLTLSVLLMYFSTNMLQTVVLEGTVISLGHHGRGEEEMNMRGPVVKAIDAVVIPVFSGILDVKNALVSVSPVESLSSGRSITFAEFIGVLFKSVVLTGGFIGVIGMMLFQKRELAAVAGES